VFVVVVVDVMVKTAFEFVIKHIFIAHSVALFDYEKVI
jgi:hypothetical protein